VGSNPTLSASAPKKAELPQTFEAFATEYIAIHSPSWRNEIHRK
jgi:hypothetical protein